MQNHLSNSLPAEGMGFVGKLSFPLLATLCLLSPGCFGGEDSTGYCEDDSFIDYDSHYACKFDLDFKQEVDISWSIVIPEQNNRNAVDVYVMDMKNYDDYRADETLFGSCKEFVYIEEVSLEFVGNWELNSTTVTLDAGEWLFVVDNKRCTGAYPEDNLRVSSYTEIDYTKAD